MATEPTEVVQKLLSNIHDAETVRSLCATDVTYVSLNYDNPDLHKVMPWCGTGHGADAIIKTFRDVGRYWIVDSFTPEDVFGEGENVAVFGRFTYTSTRLQKTVTVVSRILCKSLFSSFVPFLDLKSCSS